MIVAACLADHSVVCFLFPGRSGSRVRLFARPSVGGRENGVGLGCAGPARVCDVVCSGGDDGTGRRHRQRERTTRTIEKL